MGFDFTNEEKFLNTLELRLRSKINLADNSCWEWIPLIHDNENITNCSYKTKIQGKWKTVQVVNYLYKQLVDPTNKISLIPQCSNPKCVNPFHYKPNTLSNRFWKHVDIGEIDDCWDWKHKIRANGYGRFNVTGKDKKGFNASRLAYMLHHDIDHLEHDIFVCHKCDNRLCCNPNHLFLGTNKENMQDMRNKGRSARGERNGQAKLTDEQILSIRELWETGNYTQRKIGEMLSIAQSTVHGIVHHKRWKHI